MRALRSTIDRYLLLICLDHQSWQGLGGGADDLVDP